MAASEKSKGKLKLEINEMYNAITKEVLIRTLHASLIIHSFFIRTILSEQEPEI